MRLVTNRRLSLRGAALTCLALAAAVPARAAENNTLDARLDRLLGSNETETYSLVTKIKVPGKPLAVFDISFVDKRLPLYYLADRSNASLDVVDTRTNTVVAQIGGFVGVANDPTTGKPSTAVSGPDGVQPVGVGEIWVGDGDSSVKVVDLFSQKIVATISTALDGQTAAQDMRADEMTYDPADHILVAANNAAVPPYITMISTVPTDRHVLGHLIYSDAAGVEASIYDPGTGMIYVNLTQVGSDPNNGAVSVVDPRLMKEVKRFPVTGCNGAGLELAPGQKLIVGCSLGNNSQIISARDGTLLATIPQVSGSDEIYYNRGDNKVYLAARNNPASAGGPVLGVIDTVTNSFVTNIPTDVSAHSVAADPRTNYIYVPIGPVATDPACTSGCIAVYAGTEHEPPLASAVEAFISDLK